MECVWLEEPMPLNKEDRQWITGQIGAAVKPGTAVPRTKAQTSSNKTAWFAAICAVLPAVAGFAFWCGRLQSDVAHLQGDVTRIDGRLNEIQSSLLALRISKASTTPTDPHSQQEAKAILAEARQHSIPLPESVVEQGGKAFIDASERDPDAWGVALAFAAYRSSLNRSPIDKPTIEIRTNLPETIELTGYDGIEYAL